MGRFVMNGNFGISTVWRSSNASSGSELIRMLSETGMKSFELEYRVTQRLLKEMLPMLEPENIKILSIHNYFPTPVINAVSCPDGDAFMLSSPDSLKRRKAVDYTLKTVEHAVKLNAKAVVLHLGNIEMDSFKEKFRHFFSEGKTGSREWKTFFDEAKKKRNDLSPPYLESALKSIEEIVDCIPDGMKIGIENRNYFHQVPDFSELKSILQTFSDHRIGYWHDCGHAQVQQNMKWSNASDWLLEFGNRLKGVHFHDCAGYRDHLAPGMGEVDFRALCPFLSDDTIKILELAPSVSPEEVKNGINVLFKEGIIKRLKNNLF